MLKNTVNFKASSALAIFISFVFSIFFKFFIFIFFAADKTAKIYYILQYHFQKNT